MAENDEGEVNSSGITKRFDYINTDASRTIANAIQERESLLSHKQIRIIM